MASLNLSQNGPSITSSYQKIVNTALAGPAASSPTFGAWALFSVKAPLANAFQADASKESVLSVQTTGEGELLDLVEEFSDGRIQFAFVKVKDPNSALPKNVLIAWCGEGVPERTKGYFTSHLNAVSKVLHGYHVQVTARSDRDLTPESIVQKVADASGAKYSGGGSVPAASGRPAPPVASKPSLPTKSFGGGGGFQPLASRTRAPVASSGPVDDDGWGQDAPQVSRSQLEKVASAYQPTKVNIAELQNQHQASRYQAPASNGSGADVVSGGYKPIGKVDIAEIRRQAQASGPLADDRPTIVKGAYEPIGKVDINEIRKKAQAAPPPVQAAPPPAVAAQDNQEDDRPKSLAERSAAFSQSGRMTELPKPKVANRFGSNTSAFSGTRAPAPGGFEAKTLSSAAPVGTASKTFADEGGKTPAQIWAEKKARERGMSGAGETQPPKDTLPLQSQASGGWQSSYGGKKWDVQIPSRTGGSGISEQRTGQDQAEPPALDMSSKPSPATRGVPMPGLPQRNAESQVPAEEHQELPPPPPRPIPADEEEDEPEAPGSPVRIAMPISRGPVPAPIEPAETLPPRPVPVASLAQAAEEADPEPEPQVHEHDISRAAGQAVAATSFGEAADTRGAQGGKTAITQYDYTKDEDNEIELHEGERVTNIEMVDDDWWLGENSRGERGLFPSNYVELVEDGAGAGAGAAAAAEPSHELPAPQESAPPAGPPQPAGGALPTATAEYDYEAAEENELSFPEGAKITNIEFPDDDWWSGEYAGKTGLFPANYVVLDQ